ncbi:MAG: hypothetical protein R2759_01095 [Bacteroidales bacterium]
MVAKRTQQLFDTLVGKATLKQKVYETPSPPKHGKKGMVQLTTKYEEVETDLSKRSHSLLRTGASLRLSLSLRVIPWCL